jgi:hypothetical protein
VVAGTTGAAVAGTGFGPELDGVAPTVVGVGVAVVDGATALDATDDPLTGRSSLIGATGCESVPSNQPAAADVSRPAATPIASTAIVRQTLLIGLIVGAGDESDMRHR